MTRVIHMAHSETIRKLCGYLVVGPTGFEPATSCTPSLLKHLSLNFTQLNQTNVFIGFHRLSAVTYTHGKSDEIGTKTDGVGWPIRNNSETRITNPITDNLRGRARLSLPKSHRHPLKKLKNSTLNRSGGTYGETLY